MNQADRDTEQQTSNSYSVSVLYYISASQGAGVCEVSFNKVKIDDESNMRIQQQSEWDVFWDTWGPTVEQRVENSVT